MFPCYKFTCTNWITCSPSTPTQARVESGGKRARSPTSDGEDCTITKAQKIHDVQGARTRAKDFDDLTREIIRIAISVYRVMVCTIAPFPDQPLELSFATAAWKQACEKVEVRVQMTTEVLRMASLIHYLL